PAPPPPIVAAPPEPAGPSPINANLSQAATVWHLRAALNVAALACRAPGEAMLASQYNALLVRERTSFAVAQDGLAAEFRAGGGQWQDRYDHAMTRLYNFFSAAQAHDRFCAAAVQVMADTQALAPGTLPGGAASGLMVLDAASRDDAPPQTPVRPVIAFAAPAPVRPTPRPRLELDPSALSGD
uniref:hypothetical protein n=1 Tax=Sphingomonas bacterium TaxID=1895847 RepID=UPI001575488A